METSLLKTKLNIPPARPQFVPRPRLTERLQEGLNYNLLLVSAPAGFGKTTLLSEWARQIQPQISTAWVSLDEGITTPSVSGTTSSPLCKHCGQLLVITP